MSASAVLESSAAIGAGGPPLETTQSILLFNAWNLRVRCNIPSSLHKKCAESNSSFRKGREILCKYKALLILICYVCVSSSTKEIPSILVASSNLIIMKLQNILISAALLELGSSHTIFVQIGDEGTTYRKEMSAISNLDWSERSCQLCPKRSKLRWGMDAFPLLSWRCTNIWDWRS